MRRYSNSLRILLLAAMLLVFVSGASGATKKAPPVPEEKIIGVWIGFDQYRSEFTRLDLHADSTGYCVQVLGTGVRVYRIEKWEVEGFDLRVVLTPLTPEAFKGLRIKSRAGAASMKLQISGSGWKRELTLFPEVEVNELNERAQRAIASIPN